MGYLTYRVEVTRDERRTAAAPKAEITAYIDREPETDAPEFGRLSRAYKGVWNSRMQYTGDFATLAGALAALAAAFPEVQQICCYEYSVDYEFANEIAPLRRSAEGWRSDAAAAPAGPPPLLAWSID